MRLLIDEMFPAAVAVELRERHHADAVSVRERPDLRGRPDEDIFSAAQSERRTVVTENAQDFRPLAARWASEGRVHHGLVLTTNRKFPRARSRTLGRLVAALTLLLEGEAEDEASNREIWL